VATSAGEAATDPADVAAAGLADAVFAVLSPLQTDPTRAAARPVARGVDSLVAVP